MSKSIIPLKTIEARIHLLRGQRVILDHDLAEIYGIKTRVLNQAVRRNKQKFPVDFMFQLTREETNTVLGSRSQTVTLKRGRNIKYRPYAFTEHGAIMPACRQAGQRIFSRAVGQCK